MPSPLENYHHRPDIAPHSTQPDDHSGYSSNVPRYVGGKRIIILFISSHRFGMLGVEVSNNPPECDLISVCVCNFVVLSAHL
jgi:hypothetical protein